MKYMRVRLTFIEELLGSEPGNKNIHEDFVASKAPDAKSKEEEIEDTGVEGVIEKSKTIFAKTLSGKPHLWDYQVKGFFKDAAKGENYMAEDDKSRKLTNYKQKIDDLIFVYPRKIILQMPEGAVVDDCQRPLRADTAQGPREALANSDSAPAGTVIEFTIKIKLDSLEKHIIDYLDDGADRGIGQWRNSGKGKFLWEKLDDDGNVIGGNMRDWRAEQAALEE